ncbi:transposase family protein [Candidatus Rhabdochlamydia porcellionis]|jgi:hypothetical protein|nr:transposase family protein [Candidatus Rhabdochlamydia porcellionis]
MSLKVHKGIMKFEKAKDLDNEKFRLTKQDKKNNQSLSKERVINENAISLLKRFKILADRYRNRRKRFGLRFNLIAGVYNLELR